MNSNFLTEGSLKGRDEGTSLLSSRRWTHYRSVAGTSFCTGLDSFLVGCCPSKHDRSRCHCLAASMVALYALMHYHRDIPPSKTVSPHRTTSSAHGNYKLWQLRRGPHRTPQHSLIAWKWCMRDNKNVLIFVHIKMKSASHFVFVSDICTEIKI